MFRRLRTLKPNRSGAARGALVALAAFEAEITFLLAGRQEQIRARSERALLHLQRILAVDPDVSAKWKKAFEKNEVACERLGSVHLLSHGIYAFKVDALGARTDLVFNEPPSDAMLTQAVEGTVLTEWKIAEDAKGAIAAVRAARIQADLYSQGALAGLELRSHRYIIVVTPNELASDTLGPDDRTAAGVIYRHVNIVIEPEVRRRFLKRLLARRSRHRAQLALRQCPETTAYGTKPTWRNGSCVTVIGGKAEVPELGHDERGHPAPRSKGAIVLA